MRYKGETTDCKSLPGGGPQGTLLGLLLFLILINDCGFSDQETNVGEKITNPKKKFTPATLHAKYVDDLTIAESFNLKETLMPNPGRPLPDPYHARTGQKLISEKSQVYAMMEDIQQYANENEMKLNLSKTKFMLFNPTHSYDFIPECQTQAQVETLEEMKLLGLIISNDLKWKSNTENITKKAYKRLWVIKRLKGQGASMEDLIDVYTKQVRSVVEFGIPVWNYGLTKEDISDIERVQKSFLHILLGSQYICYKSALAKVQLETLEERRTSICEKFAMKAAKHPKHRTWFEVNAPSGPGTRSEKSKYKPPLCRLQRYQKSPIPYLTSLLNSS